LKLSLLLCFSCALIFSGLAAAAGTRPPLAKPYVVVPLVLDGQSREDAWIFPRDTASAFAVEAAPLLRLLQTHLKENLYLELQKKVSPQGTLSLRDLQGAGLSVEFDDKALELRLQLPMKYRRGNDVDLNYDNQDRQTYLRPSEQSGYINLRANQGYQYGSGNASQNASLPATGHADFVENRHGLVFETGTDYDGGNHTPWERQDTRFRYDDEARMIRYTFGDLTLNARGFQVAPSLGGVSVVREFGIQPYRTLQPISNTEIMIKRPSTVEIYVNGFMYSQMRLAPGIFNIRDFPLAIGQNNVKVHILDDLGQEEVYDFSVLFENSILTRGTSEFSYSAGYPWTQTTGDRTYDNAAVMTNLFHRYGVTDNLTVGVNYQNYLSQSLTGIEASGITAWGYLSADIGSSTGSSSGQAQGRSGFAEKFRYRSLDRMGGVDVPVTLTLETENHDPGFAPVVYQNMLQPVSYARRYDAQFNFRPWDYWTMGVGGSYYHNFNESDQRLYRANFSVPITANCRIEFTYNKSVDQNNQDSGYLSFFWNEPQGHYSASSFYDSQQKSTNLTVSKNNLSTFDDYRVTGSVQHNADSMQENINAEYYTQPAGLRLDHYSTQTGSQSANTTSLGIDTGFAWVGSHGAFTQPIADSFTLIAANDLPEGAHLDINPGGGQSQAELGPRTETVLKDQTSYYKSTVNLDSTSLPQGYLLEKEYFGVQPTYRSGILIPAHLKHRILVKGRLLAANGKGLAFATGDVLDSQGRLIDNNFFTNREGGFVIEGLEPGEYRIVTDQAGASPISLQVVENPQSLLNLGDIVVKTGGSQ
jgi:outer membrane usher protein